MCMLACYDDLWPCCMCDVPVCCREELGLKPMSKEDEEVIKMLLYGNEATGLTGIVDLEEDDLQEEEEEEGEEEGDEGQGSRAEAGQQQGSTGPADVASVVARALQAEDLVATAAEALVPGRRGRSSSSSRGARSRAAGQKKSITVVEDDADAVSELAGGMRRRRRQR